MGILHLKAKPNARQNTLLVAPDGSLTVRLHAPPQDGKANNCLLAYLATVFGVAKSSIILLAGHTSAFKKVEVAGISEEGLRAVLDHYREV